MSEPKYVVSGNRLTDGRVVFLSVDDGWNSTIADALILSEADAQARLEETRVNTNQIIEAYLVRIETGSDSRHQPTEMRERWRLLGSGISLETNG